MEQRKMKADTEDDEARYLTNNINENDSSEQVKNFVLNTINHRFGNVTKIEGVITVQHSEGETSIVINKKYSFAKDTAKICEPLDLSPINKTPEVSPCAPVSVSESDSVDMKPEHSPLDLSLINFSSNSDKPSSSVNEDLRDIDLPAENINTMRGLDETLQNVVSSLSSASYSEKQLSHYFPIQKKKFSLRVADRKVRKAEKFSKKLLSKRFLCNQCDAEFTALEFLTSHTMEVHGTYRCMECKQTFTQRSNLQRHSLKHIAFKPFICKVCEKGYNRKDHLVRHIEMSHPSFEPKANTKSLISSAKCLTFVTYCRRRGLDPSLHSNLEIFNSSWYATTREHSPSPTEMEDDSQDQQMMEDDRNIDKSEEDDVQSDDQYYRDENGELILIVKPEPVPL